MVRTKSFILSLGLCVFTGCVFQPGSIKVDVKKKNSLNNSNSTLKTISSVSVINNQIKITGTGLAGVTALKIQNNNLDETFSIESATATQIIANASHALSIGVGQIFDLILNSAEGAATFPVSFSLDNGSITAAMLSSMSASPGQILKYNGAAWVPSSISSSQLYIGTWNANTNTPDLNLTTPQAGDYYVVTTGGTQGAVTYAIGDWIISNGTTWSKLSHSSSVVGSFNGRTGLVVPASGDYTWAQINKTSSKLEDIADIDITSRVDQKVLKWDATNSKWIMGNDNTGAGAPGPGSITTTEILDGTIANGDLAGSIAQSKITNLTADLASKLGLTSLSATAPLGYDNTTGVFSITNATIALDGAMSAADKTKLNGLETLPSADGLLERFSGVLRSSVCADGEVLKWVTLTGWTCSPDSATDATKQSTLTDSAGLAGALSDESGTGLAVFNSAPTITNPVITNIAPAADFTLTQNSIAPFTSVNAGAVADTLYLNAGKVGVGTNAPGSSLDVKGTLRLSGATSGYVGFAPATAAGTSTYTLPTTQGSAGQVLSTDGVASTPTLSWVSPTTSSTTIVDGTIVNADINASAAIDYSKLNVPNAAIPLTALNATGTKDGTKYLKGDDTWASFSTDLFASVLTALPVVTNAVISTSDTVLSAFARLQKQISDLATSTVGGDLSGTLPNPTVAKIRGTAVSATAPTSGNFFKYDGSNWLGSPITIGDIKSLSVGNLFPASACAANQTLSYALLVDAFTCVDIDTLDGAKITSGTIAAARLPASASYWAVATGGINYAGGNVGIGTATPTSTLDVNGNIAGGSRWFFDRDGANMSWISARGTDLEPGNVAWGMGSTPTGTVNYQAFRTNGVERLSISSSGNVGIGTSAPSTKFEVSSGSSSVDSTLRVSVPSVATADPKISLWAGTIKEFQLGVKASDGSFRIDEGGAALGTSSRFTIASGGNVGIGTTAPTSKLEVVGPVDTSIQLYIGNSALNNTTGLYFSRWGASTNPMGIQGTLAGVGINDITLQAQGGNVGIGTNTPSESLEVNGKVKATAFLYTSDRRLKKDIHTLPDTLAKILKLRGVSFKWNSNDEKTIGFIAQEVEKIYPELVTTDIKNGYKAVQYGNIVAVLVEALKQEHEERIKDRYYFESQVDLVSRSVSSVNADNEDRLQKLEKENLELKEKLLKIEAMLLEK